MDQNLASYIKYCLGYVKLTRERTALAQQKYSINLPSDHFGLIGLLNGDTDGKLGELVNLDTFYKYDPDDVPEEELEQYEKEKALANKIEDIYNKYRNDQFTKQIILNFGYFEVELPIENGDTLDLDEEVEGVEKEPEPVKTKIDRHPLLAATKPAPASESERVEAGTEELPPPVPARPVAVKAKPAKPASNQWYELVGNETDAMVIDLYAKGLTTRDISNHLKAHHGVELSQPSISSITDKVMPLVREWQARPLESCYPILYLDGMHFKVRDAGKIVSKCAYIALGVTPFGQKEVLGIWVAETEGAKFWLGVLNDLKNRGVDDVLIACVDGLKGFPEAIKTIYPHAEVQVCIVHQIRHTVMFIPHKDKEKFCADLKSVYTAHSEEAGKDALRAVMERWPQYRSYLKSWEDRWQDLAPFYGYPEPIRRVVYTTNAIENLNRQFRKVTKTTGVFPHDESLIKLLWLAQSDLSQNWTMPVRNWGEAMAQLTILFPDRVQF